MVFGICRTNVRTFLANSKVRSSRSYFLGGFVLAVPSPTVSICIYASESLATVSYFLLFEHWKFVSDFEIRASNLPACCKHSFHFTEKIFQGDRLCLVTVESFGQQGRPVMGHRRRRDRDDGDARCLWICLEPLHRRAAVHTRQLDVHENERGPLLFNKLESLLRRLTLDGPVSFDLQHIARELPILLVILDNQNQFVSHKGLGSRNLLPPSSQSFHLATIFLNS